MFSVRYESHYYILLFIWVVGPLRGNLQSSSLFWLIQYYYYYYYYYYCYCYFYFYYYCYYKFLKLCMPGSLYLLSCFWVNSVVGFRQTQQGNSNLHFWRGAKNTCFGIGAVVNLTNVLNKAESAITGMELTQSCNFLNTGKLLTQKLRTTTELSAWKFEFWSIFCFFCS